MTVDSVPMEALAGLVERATYHNDETGFCVLRIKARGQQDLITVVGHAASIGAGKWVQMSGLLAAATEVKSQGTFGYLTASTARPTGIVS